MKKINLKSKEFSLNDFKPVTGANNGYPSPFLGYFIFADTFEELKKLQNKFNINHLNVAFWKDGWHYCNNYGGLYSNISPSEWFENCLSEDYFSVYNNLEQFIESEIHWQLIDAQTDEDKQNIEKQIEKIKKDYQNDDFFVVNENSTHEAFKLSTSYYYDTKHFRLGVFLSNENFEFNI
jgi:hypothetical protein